MWRENIFSSSKQQFSPLNRYSFDMPAYTPQQPSILQYPAPSYSLANSNTYNNYNSNLQQENSKPSFNFRSYAEAEIIKNPQQKKQQHSSPSFARNFKGRLFNADPKQQQAKQQSMRKYREQLARQMEEDKDRKKREKEKLDQIDAKYQRQFYKKIEIQAHNNKERKQQPTYFMMRTAHKAKKNKNAESYEEKKTITKLNNFTSVDNGKAQQEQKAPKISKKAYQKQKKQKSPPKLYSMVENSQQTQELIRQKILQEQRISNILLFQQNMLKKLDDLKFQIKKTNSYLETDKQLQSIRLKIRAKPLSLPGIDKGTKFDFYDLPLQKGPTLGYMNLKKSRPRSRAKSQLQDLYKVPKIKKSQQNRRKKQIYNDKNIGVENQEDYQQLKDYVQMPNQQQSINMDQQQRDSIINEGGYGTNDLQD